MPLGSSRKPKVLTPTQALRAREARRGAALRRHARMRNENAVYRAEHGWSPAKIGHVIAEIDFAGHGHLTCTCGANVAGTRAIPLQLAFDNHRRTSPPEQGRAKSSGPSVFTSRTKALGDEPEATQGAVEAEGDVEHDIGMRDALSSFRATSVVGDLDP